MQKDIHLLMEDSRIISNFRLKIKDYFNISKNCFFPKPKIDSFNGYSL